MPNVGVPILNLPTVTGLDGTEWVPLVQGGTTKRAQVDEIGFGTVTAVFPAGINYVMSGGDATVPLGAVGSGIQVPFDCEIQSAVINGNLNNGSVVVDVWKCTETDYDGGTTHPVVGDSITGGNPLTISAGSKATSDLVGWTLSLTEGDVLWYNVQSVSGFKCVTVILNVSRVLP